MTPIGSEPIPTTQPPAGLKGTVPKFTLPAASALVAEGVAHPEYEDVTPDGVTMARAGAWSDLTAEAVVSTTLAEISGAHARIIARNIDLATVTKLQSAPAAGVSIDTALATVAAEVAADVSRLWIVGDAAAIATPRLASAYGLPTVRSTPLCRRVP